MDSQSRYAIIVGLSRSHALQMPIQYAVLHNFVRRYGTVI